ncbi:phage tail protein [Salmonella enterica]|uniref:Phage tail protein n=2 Tax=Salmonella enterica TaxID=28901 RepID=A0A5U3CWG2_SALDZ|nr:phage tail protein [Salmonella enterica subsp. enterica serovar Redlands]EAS2065790.1 phage tail protein [Salmonella enterica]EBP3412684.1 phage tail protein [Salmonella enterica subsp. diarizonae]EBP3902756.1 phage tail protein [Salmonella enterica subsp. enterica]EAS2071708.1 phage tail protein [Salmonella enterica]
MTDITANVVVSNPRPIFTESRSFKAVANGKIYIGQIDTDPVNPANQIPVYIENEDGSHVQIAQPLIINAAGKIVYNGQLVKIVTVQGHSMAIYDAHGSQVDYIANVLKYDPDQLKEQLSSPYGYQYIGGDLKSYGADITGNISCSDYLDDMLKDGSFVVNSGKYLITRPHNIDVSLLERLHIGPDVEFIIRSNIDGLIFKNVLTDVIGNGMRITVDIPGGGYTRIALTIRGTKYYYGPGELDRRTQKTKFGPFYVYNKQGAIKHDNAATPILDEGYGFSIDCNSRDEEILIWNEIEVSSTGFTVAHSIGVGTNPMNFISSLELKLVSWLSTYHFRDSSIPKSSGNNSAGIGDISVRLKIQPHSQMLKVVHLEHRPGYISNSRFNLTIWDANEFGYKKNVVDATISNEYSNTLETKSYPLTRALDYVDASIYPVAKYISGLQRSDIIFSSDADLAKYLYLSSVDENMTILGACNAIKAWCIENNVRNDFEFRIQLVNTTPDIKQKFNPWLTAIGQDNGFFKINATYYNGVINSIIADWHSDIYVSGGTREHHVIQWTGNSNYIVHQVVEFSSGKTEDIKSRHDRAMIGLCSYDTVFKIPVWWGGDGNYYKADGSVAYTV